MALKFGRNYYLYLETQDGGAISIDSTEQPFTLEFDIQRDNYSSTNIASIKIYNLGRQTRENIYKGPTVFDLSKKVTLNAGYGNVSANLPLIFIGNVSQAWSYRDGNNFITQIESLDGADASVNSLYNNSYSQGQALSGIANDLINSMSAHGVSPGYVGSLPGTLQRGSSLSGRSWNLLNDFCGGNFFVDLMQANVMGNLEYLKDLAPIEVSSDTGLLGTPLRQDGFHTSCEVLFEPAVRVGQLVNLKTQATKELNALYKCIGIKHRGIISTAVNGPAITTLQLYGQPGSFSLTAPAGGH